MTSVLLSILLPWRKTNRGETRAKKIDKLNPWWCYSLWFTICLQLIVWCSDVCSGKGVMNSFPFLGTESNLTFFFFSLFAVQWNMIYPQTISNISVKIQTLPPPPLVIGWVKRPVKSITHRSNFYSIWKEFWWNFKI